jgi:hypothetical protein
MLNSPESNRRDRRAALKVPRHRADNYLLSYSCPTGSAPSLCRSVGQRVNSLIFYFTNNPNKFRGNLYEIEELDE